MKLVINGITIDKEDYTGSLNASLDISVVEADGMRKKAIAGEFVLSGNAFDLVDLELISDPNGKNKSLPVTIYEDSCCDTDILLFTGILRGDSVNWCYGDCQCTVTFIEQTEESKKIDCIKSTLVYDNWNGFQEQAHPRMVYCVEIRPDFVQYLVLIFGIIFNLVYNLIYPLVLAMTIIQGIFDTIIGFINTLGANLSADIGFDSDENTNYLQEYQNFRDLMNENLIGCGRKHPSPLVRDYISNVCDKCGLTWESSIYKNPESQYYNAVYLSAPVEKGTRDDNVLWIDANHPIKTLDLFLADLAVLHNANYRIINEVLYFERHDFFDVGEIFVSFEELFNAAKTEGKLCLSWRDDEKVSYISMQYSGDAVDIVGNEANRRFSDIVEWNLPYSELQSGHRDVVVPFGTPRFRDDGIDTDILGFFDWVVVGGMGNIINQFNSVLTLEKGTAFVPKLLLWDGNTDFGRTQKFNIPGFDVPADENYNFPYSFTEYGSEPNTGYPTDYPNTGLYTRFFSIDNPKLINDQGLDWDFTFRYDCDTLQGALTARYVLLPQGTGRITKIVINLQEKTVSLTGEV